MGIGKNINCLFSFAYLFPKYILQQAYINCKGGKLFKRVGQHSEPKRGHREERMNFLGKRKIRATRFLDFSLIRLFRRQHTNFR